MKSTARLQKWYSRETRKRRITLHFEREHRAWVDFYFPALKFWRYEMKTNISISLTLSPVMANGAPVDSVSSTDHTLSHVFCCVPNPVDIKFDLVGALRIIVVFVTQLDFLSEIKCKDWTTKAHESNDLNFILWRGRFMQQDSVVS